MNEEVPVSNELITGDLGLKRGNMVKKRGRRGGSQEAELKAMIAWCFLYVFFIKKDREREKRKG